MTPFLIDTVNEELEKLGLADYFEPSLLPFLFTDVMCEEVRCLTKSLYQFLNGNKDVVTNAYPFYRIKDQLHAMAGARWFTILDLTKGYHQMKVDNESKKVTAFLTPRGLFQYKVLLMGRKRLEQCSKGL